jgi:hypothetical protein
MYPHAVTTDHAAAALPDPTVEPLSAAEQEQLAEYESIIESGRDAYQSVSKALSQIHKRRLYRATHCSFNAYVRDRWGFSRQRAYQLIDADGASTMVDNERQAREVRGLDGDEMQAVIAQAKAASPDGRLTARALREARSTRNGTRPGAKTYTFYLSEKPGKRRQRLRLPRRGDAFIRVDTREATAQEGEKLIGSLWIPTSPRRAPKMRRPRCVARRLHVARRAHS